MYAQNLSSTDKAPLPPNIAPVVLEVSKEDLKASLGTDFSNPLYATTKPMETKDVV